MRGRENIDVSKPEPAEIRSQLDRLLDSPRFRTSRRCSDFLRHVVEASCGGRADQLKERTLGVAVFERDPDYDTNQDPIVRNTAGQVRKRLAQYYMEPGRDREIRIDLPSGSYVPEIYVPHVPQAVPEPLPGPPVAEEPQPLQTRRLAPRTKATVLAITILFSAAVAFWLLRLSPDQIEAFWSPVLKHPGTVMLVVGQGHTYRLSPALDDIFDEAAGLSGAQLPEDRSVPLHQITPAFDRYVGLTDVQALVRIAGVFSRFDKPIELRGGRTVSLADLRGKPAVLVGGFNNSWTLNLTGELRFFFEHDPANKLEIVRDRQRPDHRAWNVRTDASGPQIRTDYALVSRVFNPTTETAVVVAAGIRGGGTSAAGEFLTNPAYLEAALQGAPSGWEKGNVQFVLSIRMIGGTPGPPVVVAAHYWRQPTP